MAEATCRCGAVFTYERLGKSYRITCDSCKAATTAAGKEKARIASLHPCAWPECGALVEKRSKHCRKHHKAKPIESPRPPLNLPDRADGNPPRIEYTVAADECPYKAEFVAQVMARINAARVLPVSAAVLESAPEVAG